MTARRACPRPPPSRRQGWFALDLLCCFPSDWVYLLAVAASGQPPQQYVLLGLRSLRLLRTLRLLTHRRVYIYVSHLFARLKIRASWVALVKRTVFTIVFAHCNACLQFLLAVLAEMPDDSWVVRAGLQDQPVSSQYFASVFHAVSQMLAVGHGVALPVRNSEYVTFIISLVLGANLYAVFVGTLISVIEDANGSHREYCKRIDMLQTWMAQRQLPRHLRHKLETYYEILFPGGHAFDDEEILNSLSAPLLEEVARHKCKSLLRELRINARASPGLARQLSLSLTRSVYVSGDVIVHEGQAANGMFFIIAGRVFVHVRAMGPHPIKQLQANTGLDAIFGEMALLSPDGRAQGSISVPANAYADCFLLRREKFKEICTMYPSFKKRMEEIKTRREEEQSQSMSNWGSKAGAWSQHAGSRERSGSPLPGTVLSDGSDVEA